MFPSGKIAASDRQTGLYVIKSTVLTGIHNGFTNTVPEKFSLDQNYPNPFNPSTSISYRLPSGGFVSLKVFDAAGNEVATLVNDRQNAGTYEIRFDAGKYGLSSGIYFYSLRAEGFGQTKKMILIK